MCKNCDEANRNNHKRMIHLDRDYKELDAHIGIIACDEHFKWMKDAAEYLMEYQDIIISGDEYMCERCDEANRNNHKRVIILNMACITVIACDYHYNYLKRIIYGNHEM